MIEPDIESVLPADVKNSVELHFDATDIVELFKNVSSKSNCAAVLCQVYFGRQSASSTLALGQIKFPHYSYKLNGAPASISNKKCPSNQLYGSHVLVIGRIMLFIKLGDLHVHVHFRVSNSPTVPLLVGTLFIDKFSRGVPGRAQHCADWLLASCFCFEIHVTIRPAGCDKHQHGHLEQYQKPAGKPN